MKEVSQKLYEKVLVIHRDAMTSGAGANTIVYNIRSLLSENALSILITYPRRPGHPTTWQTDPTDACSIRVEVHRMKKRERSDDQPIAPISTSEDGHVTRAGTLHILNF